MGCETRAQLDVILKRAGSVPLRLDVTWPVRSGTLELIASSQAQIEYLDLYNSHQPSFTTQPFEVLNFNSLRELRINDICNSAAKLMDLALHSTQTDLNLYLSIDDSMIHLFEHQLLQRITCLEIYAGVSIFLYPIESSNYIDRIEKLDHSPIFNEFPNRITLPRAKKCVFRPDFRLMTAFDLNNIEFLKLIGYLDWWDLRRGTISPRYLVTTPLPTQLVELELSSVVLNYSTTTNLPHYFPNLTSLQMRRIGFHAPLLRYFNFPRLKSLHLNLVLCMQSDAMQTSAPPFLDALFFRSIPELENLSVRDMKSMDGALSTSLHFCSSLKRLQIERSVVKRFIPAFSQRVKDPKFLPNLSGISISDSWSPGIKMDHTKFIDQVQANRPGLKTDVTAGRYYSPVIPGRNSSPETSDSSS
jgi:hypothetical protein